MGFRAELYCDLDWHEYGDNFPTRKEWLNSTSFQRNCGGLNPSWDAGSLVSSTTTPTEIRSGKFILGSGFPHFLVNDLNTPFYNPWGAEGPANWSFDAGVDEFVSYRIAVGGKGVGVQKVEFKAYNWAWESLATVGIYNATTQELKPWSLPSTAICPALVASNIGYGTKEYYPSHGEAMTPSEYIISWSWTIIAMVKIATVQECK